MGSVAKGWQGGLSHTLRPRGMGVSCCNPCCGGDGKVESWFLWHGAWWTWSRRHLMMNWWPAITFLNFGPNDMFFAAPWVGFGIKMLILFSFENKLYIIYLPLKNVCSRFLLLSQCLWLRWCAFQNSFNITSHKKIKKHLTLDQLCLNQLSCITNM